MSIRVFRILEMGTDKNGREWKKTAKHMTCKIPGALDSVMDSSQLNEHAMGEFDVNVEELEEYLQGQHPSESIIEIKNLERDLRRAKKKGLETIPYETR